jgi:hypothetical protein
MKLKLKLTSKRKRLMAQWLENVMPYAGITTEQRFRGMNVEDSKEVKEILDDIYTFCKEGETDEAIQNQSGQ